LGFLSLVSEPRPGGHRRNDVGLATISDQQGSVLIVGRFASGWPVDQRCDADFPFLSREVLILRTIRLMKSSSTCALPIEAEE
jgi:hypothetical protein